MGMDITWVTDRIAVGGGIWNADNMAAAARAGITHIIDMQIEFDDTPLAVPVGISAVSYTHLLRGLRERDGQDAGGFVRPQGRREGAAGSSARESGLQRFR